MDFKHKVSKVESSPKFSSFIKSNPHYYLVHIFSVKDENPNTVWQVGYYSKDTDKIIVFEDNDALAEIIVHEPEEALKEENYIKQLELDSLVVSLSEAINICQETIKQNYPKEIPSKHIFLLQNLPEFGQVWNITIVTLAFSVINVKIDAQSGNILKHTRENLMNWRS
ncbi:MAG TPA: hypothetical protein VEC16_05020 [Alphaproteobacteria bacterium]|nr:hypothetical protein [Alphaproteobacteria bacterium]